MWDNDPEGNASKKSALLFFGEELGNKSFFTLPSKTSSTRRIIQDLFLGDDLKLIREELLIPKSSSFEKTRSSLYFSEKKSKILSKISERTTSNFDEVFITLDVM